MTKKIDTLADLTPDGENFNRHTEFGQKLLEDSLRKFGAGRSILVDKDGNIIAGNFGGSGSTMIACEQLGRKCRMMELDPHYCDVIIARWEKLTGNKAERRSNGNDSTNKGLRTMQARPRPHS